VSLANLLEFQAVERQKKRLKFTKEFFAAFAQQLKIFMSGQHMLKELVKLSKKEFFNSLVHVSILLVHEGNICEGSTREKISAVCLYITNLFYVIFRGEMKWT
jgi:hypothetical protein